MNTTGENKTTEKSNYFNYEIDEFIGGNPKIIRDLSVDLLNGKNITVAAPPSSGKTDIILRSLVALSFDIEHLRCQLKDTKSKLSKLNSTFKNNLFKPFTEPDTKEVKRLNNLAKEIKTAIYNKNHCADLSDFKFILLAPFTDQTLQLEKNIKVKYPITHTAINVYSSTSKLKTSNKGLDAEQMTICTYDKSVIALRQIISQLDTDKVIIIEDESHVPSQSVSFRKSAVLGLEKCIKNCYASLFLSATPDFISDIAQNRKIYKITRNNNPIIKYNFIGFMDAKDRKEAKIKTPLNSKEHIVLQTIIFRLKLGLNVFARINSVSLMNYICRYLTENNILKRNEINIVTGSSTVVRSESAQYIAQNEKVPDNCRVLLATEVLDQAINLTNTNFCIVYLCLLPLDHNGRNLAQVPQRLRVMVANCDVIFVDVIINSKRIDYEDINEADYYNEQWNSYIKRRKVSTWLSTELNTAKVKDTEYKRIAAAHSKVKNTSEFKISNYANFNNVSHNGCVNYDKDKKKWYSSAVLIAHEELKQNCRLVNMSRLKLQIISFLGRSNIEFSLSEFESDISIEQSIFDAINTKKEIDKENKAKAVDIAVDLLENKFDTVVEFLLHNSKDIHLKILLHRHFKCSKITSLTFQDLTNTNEVESENIKKNVIEVFKRFFSFYRYYPVNKGRWILNLVNSLKNRMLPDVNKINSMFSMFHISTVLSKRKTGINDNYFRLMSIHYGTKFDFNIKLYNTLFNLLKNNNRNVYKCEKIRLEKIIASTKGVNRSNAKRSLQNLKLQNKNIVDVTKFVEKIKSSKVFNFKSVDKIVKDEKNQLIHDFIQNFTNGKKHTDRNGKYNLTKLEYDFVDFGKSIGININEYINWFQSDIVENLNAYMPDLFTELRTHTETNIDIWSKEFKEEVAPF